MPNFPLSETRTLLKATITMALEASPLLLLQLQRINSNTTTTAKFNSLSVHCGRELPILVSMQSEALTSVHYQLWPQFPGVLFKWGNFETLGNLILL